MDEYDAMILAGRLNASREARLRDAGFVDRGQGRWVRPERDALFSRCCWPYTLIELRDEWGRVRDTTLLVWFDGYEEDPEYYAALAAFQDASATCSCDEEEGDDDDCQMHGDTYLEPEPYVERDEDGEPVERVGPNQWAYEHRANDHPEFD